MPTRAELSQYQKRFLELYNQGQWTNVCCLCPYDELLIGNIFYYYHTVNTFLHLLIILFRVTDAPRVRKQLSYWAFELSFSFRTMNVCSNTWHFCCNDTVFSGCKAQRNKAVLHNVQYAWGHKSLSWEGGKCEIFKCSSFIHSFICIRQQGP